MWFTSICFPPGGRLRTRRASGAQPRPTCRRMRTRRGNTSSRVSPKDAAPRESGKRWGGKNPRVLSQSEKLAPVHESYITGKPVEWVEVHQLAEYAFFDHQAHVNKGVSCVSCHGRVDRMEVVYQVEPLSMSWCLDCHREPEKHLRPVEEVYNLGWKPQVVGNETLEQAQLRIGKELKEKYNIHDRAYMTACSTCHR